MLKKMYRPQIVWVALIFLTISAPAPAKLPFSERFSQGKWRGEITTTSLGIRQRAERRDDWMIIGALDYEWPIADKSTLAIRGYPLLLYYLDENEHNESEYIYAGGVGIAARQYQKRSRCVGMQKGLYGEVGFVPIWQSDNFKNNGSRINFVLNAGIGYEFDNGISLSGKYYHISNANLDDDNQGLDLFAISLGCRF